MYTISQVDAIRKKIPVFKKHLPMIFENVSNRKEIVELLTKYCLIRSVLADQGRPISDAHIKEQADMQRKRNKLSESEFHRELDKEGLNYDDYLFITRLGMEYSLYMDLIIGPAVSVTDSEIQELYLKKFNRQIDDPVRKYELVVFSTDKLNEKDLKEIVSVLTEFRKTGNLPAKYRNISTTNLGIVEEDLLDKQVASVITKTTEGNFSKPILRDNKHHSFFVKSITVDVASDLQDVKDRLENELLEQKMKSASWEWPKNERANHYIKNLL